VTNGYCEHEAVTVLRDGMPMRVAAKSLREPLLWASASGMRFIVEVELKANGVRICSQRLGVDNEMSTDYMAQLRKGFLLY